MGAPTFDCLFDGNDLEGSISEICLFLLPGIFLGFDSKGPSPFLSVFLPSESLAVDFWGLKKFERLDWRFDSIWIELINY